MKWVLIIIMITSSDPTGLKEPICVAPYSTEQECNVAKRGTLEVFPVPIEARCEPYSNWSDTICKDTEPTNP